MSVFESLFEQSNSTLTRWKLIRWCKPPATANAHLSTFVPDGSLASNWQNKNNGNCQHFFHTIVLNYRTSPQWAWTHTLVMSFATRLDCKKIVRENSRLFYSYLMLFPQYVTNIPCSKTETANVQKWIPKWSKWKTTSKDPQPCKLLFEISKSKKFESSINTPSFQAHVVS